MAVDVPISAILSVVIGLASVLLGLPLVFTIVVAIFIRGYIPYVGAFLGGGLPVTVALSAKEGFWRRRSCCWSCLRPTCCSRTSARPR